MFDGVRTCSTCTSEKKLFTASELQAQEKDAAEARKRTEREKEEADIEPYLAQFDNPIEKLVRGVTSCCVNCRYNRPQDDVYDSVPEFVYTRHFATIFPGSFKTFSDEPWQPEEITEPSSFNFDWNFRRPEEFSNEKIAAWFASRANDLGVSKRTQSILGPKRDFLGRPKTKARNKAYRDNGTRMIFFGDPEDAVGWPVGKADRSHSHGAFVREDGALIAGEWFLDESGQVRPSGSLCLRSLFVMGLLLGTRPATVSIQPNQFGFQHKTGCESPTQRAGTTPRPGGNPSGVR